MVRIFAIFLILISSNLFSQSTQDTIDFPYWIDMMFDNSNNYYDVVRAYDLYFSNKEKAKGTGYKQFERWAYRAASRIDEKGNFLPNEATLSEFKKFQKNKLQTRSASGNWKNLGPFNNPQPENLMRGVGRINAINFHPTNSNIIYAGAPQGGFWISNNNGESWTSTTDNLPTLGVSDIVTIQTGSSIPLILIGTGDRDASDSRGLGVYKSVDGGNTFSESNTGMGNVTVNILALNPQNSNTIFAATSKGIFVSYDQGENWTRKSSNSSNYKDIKYCPNDTSTLYATLGGSFYRSINAGNTWTRITSGFRSIGRNRMAIGVSPHNSNIVYLVASKSNGSTFESLYKSADKGLNFTPMASDSPNILGGRISGNDNRGQGWYDLAIAVSPSDSNTILVGGINIFNSNDGGKTWKASASWYGEGGTPFVHADIHTLVFRPNSNQLYVGSDGGVDISPYLGNSYESKNNGLAISQFYNLGVSQLSKSRFITGAQDNGTSVGSASNNWIAELGADGMQCEISNFDTAHLFGCSQYGGLQKSTNNGQNWRYLKNKISDNGPWNTPYHLHPRVDNILVAVYKNVWISNDVITANSPDFTKLTPNISANGSAIRFSNINDNLVFFGWANGNIKYSDNILSNNPTVTSVNNPFGSGAVRDIETSYENEDVLYALRGNKISKSEDKGQNWTDITGNLPNIPLFSIVIDKNSYEGLYVGTDAGVYYKDSSMNDWILYNTGLPLNSEIRDLEIVYDSTCSSKSKIFAATYGRGLWEGDLMISETEPIIDIEVPSYICKNTPINLKNISSQTDSNTKWEWIISPDSNTTYLNSTNSQSFEPVINFTKTNSYNIIVKARNDKKGFCQKEILNSVVGGMYFKHENFISMCDNDSFKIEVAGMKSYNWDSNTDIKKIDDSTAYIYPKTNKSFFIYGNTDNLCFDTLNFNVSVSKAPILDIDKEEIYLKLGDTINISIDGATSYKWSPTSYIYKYNTTNKSSVSIIPRRNLSYKITGTSNGCNSEKTIKLIIDNSANSSIGSLNNYNLISIYPNPTKNSITINSKQFPIQYTIYNQIGQIVLSGVISRNEKEVNVSSLSSGIYHITIIDSSQVSTKIKLSIED